VSVRPSVWWQGTGNDAPVRKGAHVSSLVHMFEDPRSAGRMQDHDKLKVHERVVVVSHRVPVVSSHRLFRFMKHVQCFSSRGEAVWFLLVSLAPESLNHVCGLGVSVAVA
jgi:hypothetical protein